MISKNFCVVSDFFSFFFLQKAEIKHNFVRLWMALTQKRVTYFDTQ